MASNPRPDGARDWTSPTAPADRSAFDDTADLVAPLVEALSEPALLVDRDGLVLCRNAAARAIFHAADESGLGLAALVADSRDALAERLRRWLSCTGPLPGSLHVRQRGAVRRLHVEGNRCRLPSPYGACVLIRVVESGPSIRRFRVLTERNDHMAAELGRRNEMEAELAGERDRAEAANRYKTEFLAGLSHDLRTPLTAIVGFAEIIDGELFGPVAPGRYREYAHDIHVAARHLLSIVDNLLDLSTIEAGRLVLDSYAVDIVDLVKSCTRFVAGRAREKSVSLTVANRRDLPLVVCDHRVIRQAVINVIDNAVKFTDAGGGVRVFFRQNTDGGLSVVVADTGVGFTARELDRVLKPYGQGEHGLRAQGTGLGVPLSRGMMAAHGGGFEIESVPDVGTTVTLTFPPERIARSAAGQGAPS